MILLVTPLRHADSSLNERAKPANNLTSMLDSVGSSPHSVNSGLMGLDSVLKKNVPPISSGCPVTFCFSSIGTLGADDAGKFRILGILTLI